MRNKLSIRKIKTNKFKISIIKHKFKLILVNYNKVKLQKKRLNYFSYIKLTKKLLNICTKIKIKI